MLIWISIFRRNELKKARQDAKNAARDAKVAARES